MAAQCSQSAVDSTGNQPCAICHLGGSTHPFKKTLAAMKIKGGFAHVRCILARKERSSMPKVNLGALRS